MHELLTSPARIDGPRFPARGIVAVGLLLGLAAGGVQACSKRLPHGGDDPLYPLLGRHAALPCEACHGEGTPQTLPTACIDCHDADRPTPSHYPGQDCAECHVADGWDVGVTTLLHTGHTGVPVTDTAPTTTDVHASLAPDRKCWDCHEKDRKDPTHYADPADQAKSWDCGPCHATTTWTDDLYVHPARTPHATHAAGTLRDEGTWVVACADCHPASLKAFDCQTCHQAIFTPPHYGDCASGPSEICNAACLGCHRNGDL